MPQLAKLLLREGNNVNVILTENAQFFLDEDKFTKLDIPVYTKLFDTGFDHKSILDKRKVDHIEVAKSTDIFVIAPATAHTIAKLAHGLADDFLTTTALATTSPILICPSMNSHMWENAAVKENIKIIQSRGYRILQPSIGDLACGYHGTGRLPALTEIKRELMHILKDRNKLKGKKILISTGPTHEYLDSIRFITNRSSGKMGCEIADIAYASGAEVLLLRSVASVKPINPIMEKMFTTTDELLHLIEQYSRKYDYFYHVAAVSDFKIVQKKTGKLDSSAQHSFTMYPEIKIIDYIKKNNPSINLISFKAVFGDNEKEMINAGNIQLKRTNSDYVVVNNIADNNSGFASDNNEVFVVSKKNDPIMLPLSSKRLIAKKIIAITCKV